MDLTNIDYTELKKQKAILINMIEDWGSAEIVGKRNDAAEVEGLLTLIDAIQDNAIDNLGMTFEEVFGVQ